MFRYEKEQIILTIGEVKFGGQPGELPTVLIGTRFYHGHKIIRNPKKGIFDKPSAEALITRQEELSEMTGIPQMLDMVGEALEALVKEVDFVASVTKAPLLIDGLNEKIRIPAAKYAVKAGLGDRIIYNSLGATAKEAEISAVANH